MSFINLKIEGVIAYSGMVTDLVSCRMFAASQGSQITDQSTVCSL